jgi:isoquinoline 1-oxidoreductase subunit beta
MCACRACCKVDCGCYVNPETIRAQVKGGIVYGLSAALKGEIPIANGRVEQSNFNDYDLLRINETPQTEVHIVQSADGPAASASRAFLRLPAVCNAIFAATGKPVRRLPIRAEDLA